MALSSPRASARETIWLPTDWSPKDVYAWVKMIAGAVRELLNGKLETVSTVTLTANAATTTISDERIGPETMVVLTPTTANAAAALATTYQTIPNGTSGALVINHANNAQTDRIFKRVLVG